MCINGTVGFNKSNDQISNIKALPTVIDFIFFPLLSHLIHISYAHVTYNIALVVVSPIETARKKMNQNILPDVF